MELARRVVQERELNELSRTRNRLAAAGIPLTDLTDSNPTRHGLLRPDLLEIVARHATAPIEYEPHPRGPVAAREALAAHFGGQPDDYWLTTSTSESYSWLMTILANPGEAVAIPAPGYPLIDPLARLAAVRTVPYRLHYAHPHEWILDAQSLRLATSTDGVRAVVTVNPGNPTGAYLGPDSDPFVDACLEAGLPLIADEVFRPFALDDEPSSWADEMRLPTVTLGGLSKLICAPQLKLAWMRVSGPREEVAELREALDMVADTFLPVSAPVAAALPTLLANADGCVAATRDRLRANLVATHRLLAGGGFRVRRCGAGWNVVIDVPRAVATQDIALELLERAHLFVHPGWFYDLESTGALVVSLLPRPETFEANISRLRDAVVELARGD